MCVAVLSSCLSVYYMCALCLETPEEGSRSLKMELQMFVSHHVGWIGTETLSHLSILPVSKLLFLFVCFVFSSINTKQ